MKTKLTLALAAILTGTAFGSMPAAMPEFKNAKQLADWRAEVTAKSVKETNSNQENAFYTGKPYVESSGGYAFKYRSYNPELARWTSEDPSGFPDGANGNTYSPCPTSDLDWGGLWRIKLASDGVGQTATGGTLGPYTWQDGIGVIGYGHISINGSEGDIKDSWNYSIVASATRNGHPITVTAQYTIKVRDDGSLYVYNATGTDTLGADLNVSIRGAFAGEESKNLSYSLGVAALYKATGIDGFGIQVKSNGVNLKWTTAEHKASGIVPKLWFEAVE